MIGFDKCSYQTLSDFFDINILTENVLCKGHDLQRRKGKYDTPMDIK